MKSKLSDEIKNKIKTAIETAERKTSIEFISVFGIRSSRYFEFRILATLCVGFSAFIVLEYSNPFELHQNIAISFAMMLFVMLLMMQPAILNLVLPDKLKQLRVVEEAHQQFVIHEVFATRERTGVLIYISELEKKVFILADKGLLAKAPENEWQELGQSLAQDLAKTNAGDTFLQAIKDLEDRHADDFRPRDDNINEISDIVREI